MTTIDVNRNTPPVDATPRPPMRTNLKLGPGCALLPTTALRLLIWGAHTAITNHRIVCVSGQSGCGKTVALDVLANDLAARGLGRVVQIELFDSTTDKQVIAQLLAAVTGERVNPRHTTGDHALRLRKYLADEPVVLHIDEAQHASVQALQIVRQINDDPTSKSGLVLAGENLKSKLAKHTTLANRVGLQVNFGPIDEDQLGPTIRALHPALKDLSDAQITFINDKFAVGTLRSWVVILEWLIARTASSAPLSPNDINYALTAVSGAAVSGAPR